jgi:phage-related protein
VVERLEVPLEDPQAALERAIIDDFLRSHGHDPRALWRLPTDQIKAVLCQAAQYAAIRLAEHEARAHYVHEMHGTLDPIHMRSRLKA